MLAMVPLLPLPLLSAQTFDAGYADDTSYHAVSPVVIGITLFGGGEGLGGSGGGGA